MQWLQIPPLGSGRCRFSHKVEGLIFLGSMVPQVGSAMGCPWLIAWIGLRLMMLSNPQKKSKGGCNKKF
jgi:hypothetical protein